MNTASVARILTNKWRLKQPGHAYSMRVQFEFVFDVFDIRYKSGYTDDAPTVQLAGSTLKEITFN